MSVMLLKLLHDVKEKRDKQIVLDKTVSQI